MSKETEEKIKKLINLKKEYRHINKVFSTQWIRKEYEDLYLEVSKEDLINFILNQEDS
jgi:hypothetical protein